MTCAEVRARLHAYVDGELTVSDMTELDGHCVECRECAARVAAERELRQLLRRQPRDTAPPDLRARILHRIRRDAAVATARRWLPVPAIVTAVLLAVRAPSPLIADLVDKHIAYAELERPGELVTSDPREVADWFRSRAGMRVTVPDYSPAGIHLTGARLAEAHERRAAYLLYEKGRTLLSVFMVPAVAREADLPGRRVVYRDHEYVAYEHKGYRTISWSDGQTVYGLVSMLDYQALLECADRLRAERARQTQL